MTTAKGANRVYALGGHTVVFESRPSSSGLLVDTEGRTWRQTEAALTLDDGSVSLPRYVAHRAFWFGWYAQDPGTRLIGRAVE